MSANRDPRDQIEYPRGEIEIIAPGEEPQGHRNRFEFEGASAARSYSFQTRTSGFLGLVFATLVAVGLFVFVAGFFAVVVTIALAVVAGFYLRNKLRRWLGR